MTQKIPSFISDINNEMIDAAVHALENEKFILGESVFKFEEEFAKYIGTKNAISVNSGSSALHLSLLAVNISNNSKVIAGTYAITSQKLILFVKVIDTESGNILYSQSTSTPISNEILELEGTNTISQIYTPLVL